MSRKGSKSSPDISPSPRQPHRSGQEYEYGETPETGLGGGGVGADPSKAHARHSARPTSQIASEQQPQTPTRQNGGGTENSGFARDRGGDRPQEAGKGGRRAQYDDDNMQSDVTGQHGVPPHIEHDR